MQFFVPHFAPNDAEAAYQGIVNALKSQFRLPILERRIFGLHYLNSRKRWHAEVGQLEQQEGRYEILAILESKSYIIVTQAKNGSPGPIIMVDKHEVTKVEDFETEAAPMLHPQKGTM